MDKLDKMGIVCDRRTLYKDIEVLNSFGYEVLCEKSPGKPNCYCVADRSFDVPELRILMDAVQASSFITPKTEYDDLFVQTYTYCPLYIKKSGKNTVRITCDKSIYIDCIIVDYLDNV